MKLLEVQYWCPPVLTSISDLERTLPEGEEISLWRVKYRTPVGSRESSSDTVHLHGFKPEMAGTVLGEEVIAHLRTDINQLSCVWDGPFQSELSYTTGRYLNSE